MLEHMRKPPIEAGQILLNVVCQQAMMQEITSLLESKGCQVKPMPEVEKERYTPEEVFPGFHGGDALRGARYREDVSQRNLAKLSGVSVSNISAMENGRRPIGKDIAKRFAKILNIDWRVLISE